MFLKKLSREKASTPKDAKIGALGESIACKYLIHRGYSIIERNYLRPWGEIDIVAQKAGEMHFIEVKTVSREPNEGIRPEENLHIGKLKRLERVISSYLMDHTEVKNWQLDAVLIHVNRENKKAKVAIVENIL